MPNRLADAHSPYLLQHRDNPVDWYPWGEAAFEKAEQEDKPVFLSIGYSTCHWCHVMAHESFEDEAVARLMNEAFVSIKVDREERPDIDHLYMTVCQMMTRQGGWPLNVLLTPDKKPFHAATYIPKEGRFGRMGMMQLVPRIQELWQNERERVLESANGITDTIRSAEAPANGEATLDASVLDDAFETLAGRFDAAHGGFGQAPKFPSPHTLLLLLRQADRAGSDRALKMAQTTLDAMRRGGIFDHLGGGFHRYATDARWRVPHFEKMLYDQAMLAMAYTEAFQMTGEARYEETTRAIFEYVLRDLHAPEGGFYSAEDADSEGREGAFYLWTTKEIREVLNEDEAALVIDIYNFEDEGNFEDESTGRRTGENILYLDEPLSEIVVERDVDEADLRERLSTAEEKLFAHREQRERPGLDDKILADWNGLMIAALAKAGAAFDEPAFIRAAEEATAFVIEHMRSEEGRLQHRYRGSETGIRAQLDDYGCLAFGLLELYAATGDPECLDDALAVTEAQRDHFWDDEHGGFFLTAEDDEELLVRQKTFYDGAVPSGNSISLLNLLRLARLTGRTDLEDDAQRLADAAAGSVRQQPAGFAALLMGLDFAFGPTREVVVVGDPAADDTEAMLGALRRAYLPRAVTLFRPDGEEPTVSNLAPFTAEQRMQNGQATAYVCQDFQCQAPTNDLDAMLASLDDGPLQEGGPQTADGSS